MEPKNTTRGRPPSDDPHTFRVRAGFTLAERERLETLARVAGLSLSEYMRRRALADSSSPPEPLSRAPVISRRA
jgi:hypothetical protein